MISDRIKDIIKKKGMTSIEVAQQMNISRESFSRTINGNPTVSSLQSIADALGCEIGDFFVKSEPIIIKIDNDLRTFYSIEEFKKFAEEQ